VQSESGADPEARSAVPAAVTTEARGGGRRAPSAERTRLRLDVSYDGTGFRGFAAQPGQRTVAGVLADAIAVVAGHPVELVCAGRTDAGVHAEGQVVHVDVHPEVDVDRLLRSVNTITAPQVVVRAAGAAPDGFDARRSACARRYRYLIYEAPTADPLLARQAWHVEGPLDLRAMVSAADCFVGEHDFRAFCRRVPGSSPDAPIMRRVLDARLGEVPGPDGERPSAGRLLRFDVTATSFCHQMVRSIVGILAEVGRGRRRASDVVWLLREGDRSRVGGVIAPPQGLCLVAVAYDD
jgi:tRNA pseudouridine38-40 synthase